MKTFEQLTIDELVDYCISLRETEDLYKEFPKLKNLLLEKLNEITDTDEKEFYECIVSDVMLEITSNSYLSDYEKVKDKIVEDSFRNFDEIDQKVNQILNTEKLTVETEKTDENSLENILSDIEFFNKYELHSRKFLEELRELSQERVHMNDLLNNNRSFYYQYINISMRRNNLELQEIGEFQRLDFMRCRKSVYNTHIPGIIETICCSLLGISLDTIMDLFRSRRNRVSDAVTCFKMVDKILPTENHSMSYFKINRRKNLSAVRPVLERSRWINTDSSIKNYTNFLNPDSVIWFKLDMIGDSNSFDYSNIYKNEAINRKAITWFKLMSNSFNTDHHSTFAYSRIDIDGSVTEDEIAYFETNKDRVSIIEDLNLNNDQIDGQLKTLHYFVADDSIDVTNNVPLVIGYSACNSIPFITE